MEINPPPARLARIAGMIRQQLQLMQTGRIAKIAGHTDLIVDGLERIVKFRSAQEKAIARNWPATARKMVRQTAIALRDLPRYITDAQRGIQASQAAIPSLRDLYGEIIQLRQEFDGISCSCKDSRLAIHDYDVGRGEPDLHRDSEGNLFSEALWEPPETLEPDSPTGVAEIDELSSIEARKILARVFQWMYWNPDTGQWDLDRDISGADTVQLLCELMPYPPEPAIK